MSTRRIVGIEVLDDRRGAEGYLRVRTIRCRLRRDDGSLSAEGRYDFVERPMGRDAVVLALYRTVAGRVEVLIRRGLRIPLWFDGVDGTPSNPPALHPELVAGIIERDDETGAEGVKRRAADEALEEAGITVADKAVVLLGAASFATPGICAERFHFAACDVSDADPAVIPDGDGSCFEEGATLEWIELDTAIADAVDGRLADVKTELALRRLRDHLVSASK